MTSGIHVAFGLEELIVPPCSIRQALKRGASRTLVLLVPEGLATSSRGVMLVTSGLHVAFGLEERTVPPCSIVQAFKRGASRTLVFWYPRDWPRPLEA